MHAMKLFTFTDGGVPSIDDRLPTMSYNEHRNRFTRSSFVGTIASGNSRFILLWIIGVLTSSSTTAATVLSINQHQPSQVSRPQQQTDMHHQQRRIDTDTTLMATKTIVRKRLLAIRVSSLSSGETPEESLISIRSAIFGYRNVDSNSSGNKNESVEIIPSNATSVIEQYQFISHGQLVLEPVTNNSIKENTAEASSALTTTRNIEDGVFDLYIPNISFSGHSISDLTDIIVQEALRQLSPSTSLSDIADHIIFCLPNGSSFQNDPNWTAYTYLNQPYSYYQLSRCTRLSVVVHELGHSLGFQHSGVGTSPYADKTGYMGFASNQIGYPLKAFNGHKHWISGWFRDRSVVVKLTDGPVEHRLVSFVHYSDSSDPMLYTDAVLIRIGNLYLQYNRAKSYNVDADMPNTVTITHAIADDDVSDRLAALSAGEMFQYLYSTSTALNSPNQNRFLIVQVCSALKYNTSQIDYATIRVYFSDEDNIQVLSDCKKEFISQNRTGSPSDDSNLPVSPTISPAIVADSLPQRDDPIVDRDDNDDQAKNSSVDDGGLSLNGKLSDNDNNGSFEGMIYVIISSALGVMFFAGTGYYYVTQHLQEQQKIMALQGAHGKYPQKMETKRGTTTSSSRNRNHLTDVEDLSATAEDEEDDERDDTLYVMYDTHMLEI